MVMQMMQVYLVETRNKESTVKESARDLTNLIKEDGLEIHAEVFDYRSEWENQTLSTRIFERQ